MIPTSQKISRVYNTHVMPTRTKWRTPHTINYCPYSLQLTRWTLFYLLGRACPKHPRYGPSNELCLLVHSLNLFCVLFMLAIVCTYMLMPTGSLQLLLLLYQALFPLPQIGPGYEEIITCSYLHVLHPQMLWSVRQLVDRHTQV